MSKNAKVGLKGFLIGLTVIAVVFVLTVLIMASCNGRSFPDEIKSWGAKEEQTLPDESTENDSEDIVHASNQSTVVVDIDSNAIVVY